MVASGHPCHRGDGILAFQRRFTCRSAEYSYMTLQCHLSEHDRRSVDETIEMVDADQVDYFENLCLSGENRPSDSWEASRLRAIRINGDSKNAERLR